MPISWIVHKGVKILYADYEGLSEEEFIKEMEQTKKIVLHSGEKIIHTLINATGTKTSKNIVMKGREVSKAYERVGIKSIKAMFGLSGVKKIIANTLYGADDYFITETEEEALNWLAQQKGK